MNRRLIASVLLALAVGLAHAQDEDAAIYWKKRMARKQECAVAVVQGYAGRALYLRKLDRAPNRASAARAMQMTCNVDMRDGNANCYGVTYLPPQKVNVFDDTDDRYMTVFATVPLNLGDVTAMLELHKSDAQCVKTVAALRAEQSQKKPAAPPPPAEPPPQPSPEEMRHVLEEQRRATEFLANPAAHLPQGM